MCDERTLRQSEDYLQKSGPLSRRTFSVLTGAAAVATMLPSPAGAVEVSETDVSVETPEGSADCYFVHPASGKHPGVLVWPDAMGLRPAFRAMGKRLAESGYAVLVVNQYYRTDKAPVLPEGATINDPGMMDHIMSLYKSVTTEMTETDAKAFIPFLDQQHAVDKKRKMGTTGYCMGGPMTIRTAALFPERVGAGASFHGARLVTDQPDSPHLLIPKLKASFLIAIAENDDEADPEAKNVLREEFDKAGLPAEIEVYKGAMHGWCPPDTPVYNEAQAEHAWSRLLALFDTALA